MSENPGNKTPDEKILEDSAEHLGSSFGPGKTDSATKTMTGSVVGVCPDCGAALRHVEGCQVCNACGYSKC
jgi:hypothetical protein